MSAVDVRAAIQRQKESQDSMRIFPLAARKPRKTIKRSDVDAAVNEVLDELDREFRRFGVEFPKGRAAFDVARVAVQNKRRPQA